MAVCHDSNKQKRSSKGVQGRVLLTYEDYKRAVYESQVMDVDNVSIRLHNNRMKTINSKKKALKNLLCKAYVHDDKITVTPFKKFQ